MALEAVNFLAHNFANVGRFFKFSERKQICNKVVAKRTCQKNLPCDLSLITIMSQDVAGFMT